MKIVRIVLFLAFAYACNLRITTPHVAVFNTVESLMRSDTSRTGFFTNVSLFDTAYDQIKYVTTQGTIFVPNDGSQNFLLCRYDTATLKPIWVAVGGGSGRDGGCNYYTVPPENSVYVVGYFEDTAFFPHRAGMQKSDTLISNGMADMFIAKYCYDNGDLQWCRSYGSKYSDIIFTDNLGNRHQETILLVDSVNFILYANFFGPVRFGDQSIEAPLSGSVIRISCDKETGEVREAEIPDSLPHINVDAPTVSDK